MYRVVLGWVEVIVVAVVVELEKAQWTERFPRNAAIHSQPSCLCFQVAATIFLVTGQDSVGFRPGPQAPKIHDLSSRTIHDILA
ncbi:hypothetical protein A0H81_03710 [Grifola frondosa]|uniref:Secreted protein n=1 Tax=Grifola frondosa TaxID=5627 RepID=A0A1C7MJN7_GRIFR|nr:hypothetical protein A0H81_03710 [Grifola frondosa]